jgi:hypothetical protein
MTLPFKLTQAVVTATIPQIPAMINLDSRMPFAALRTSKVEIPSPANQTTNVEAIGNATRMQGYVARLGLGMTLIKNQISENSPNTGNSIFDHLGAVCLVVSLFSIIPSRNEFDLKWFLLLSKWKTFQLLPFTLVRSVRLECLDRFDSNNYFTSISSISNIKSRFGGTRSSTPCVP